MEHVKTVTIAVQPAYEARIQNGLVRDAGAQLAQLRADGSPSVFVITTAAVRKHWGSALADSLSQAKLQFHKLEMGDGERYKTMATVEELATRLVERGADRRSLLVALGGGVVGDVTGFLAGIYMRGIRFVQIPTTFLSQVDSSASAAKPASTSRAAKISSAYFKQPELVLADPQVLTTLPDREFRSGLYESLKARSHPQPRHLRLHGAQTASRSSPKIPLRWSGSSPSPCASRPTWSAKTKKSTASAKSSTSATPSATPSKPKPNTNISSTEKPWPGA